MTGIGPTGRGDIGQVELPRDPGYHLPSNAMPIAGIVGGARYTDVITVVGTGVSVGVGIRAVAGNAVGNGVWVAEGSGARSTGVAVGAVSGDELCGAPQPTTAAIRTRLKIVAIVVVAIVYPQSGSTRFVFQIFVCRNCVRHTPNG
ncbi:MAG: hypothetical protein QF878_13505 [SAR202 cluster bacterium]|nr:hypothetical protein [SAR202 cluster bacterium]MDP6715912.1 hypothetical protein [SAR202 cluster bacterium]